MQNADSGGNSTACYRWLSYGWIYGYHGCISSYQDKEKKLAILKDPHIGAFSVLMLVLYYLIYGAAYAELTELSAILVVGIGFALSRSLSGIGVVSLKAAKRMVCLLILQTAPRKKECWQSSS